MNSRQWFFVFLVPVMFSVVNFFMFSSSSLLESSVLWFFIGYILFLAVLTAYLRKFSFSIQGFVSGVFNVAATVIVFFLYSFNFITNVFPFLASGIILFFAMDYFVSGDRNFNSKMIVGGLLIFAGLIVTQDYGFAMNFFVIALGVLLMIFSAISNFVLLYRVDEKNLGGRIQSFLLPSLAIPLLLLFTKPFPFNFNGFFSGFLSAVGFFVFCYALIEIYNKKMGLWSRNLINVASYLDIVILNVLAVLLFQGRYTLNGLAGSLIVFAGIAVFVLSQPN